MRSTLSTHASPGSELPDLQPGVTLLDTTTDLGVTPTQALIVDRALTAGGDVYWVDGNGAARTTTLRELAPHRRLLDRIHVARGFTAHQHASLLDRLGGRLDADYSGCDTDTDADSGADDRPALVVVTGMDRLYLAGDVDGDTADELFVRGIAALAGVAREHDVPVLITRTRESEFTAPLHNAAETHLRCESTRAGPRFTADDDSHETMLYDVGSGYVQTTIAFWREVLTHRARLTDADVSAPTPVAAPTPTGSGAHGGSD